MAGFGEPLDWTRRREEEAKDVFPTLQFADPDQNMEVDVFASQNLNQPFSAFSQSALGLANYAYAPEPTPDAPDVAPNVEGWTPQISPAVPQPWGEPTYDPSRPDTLLQRTPGLTPLEVYGKTQQASLGFFTGSNPVESYQRALRGIRGEETFSPYELGFTRLLPEESALREPFARVTGQLVDPINLLTLGQTGAAKSLIAGIGAEEAVRAASQYFGASPETQESLGAIANIVGNIAGPNAIDRLAPRAKTWMEAAEDAMGLARMAEQEIAPEAFQIGRGAGEGRVPFYGGTRPGEVPVPLQRPAMAGAADFSNLSDDAIDASINAIRKAEAAGQPTAPGLIDELIAEQARRAGGTEPFRRVENITSDVTNTQSVSPPPPIPSTRPTAAGAGGGNANFGSTPTLNRLYGVGDIREGDTRGRLQAFQETGRIRKDDPIVTPAFSARAEARNAVVNQATRLTTQTRNIVRRSGFDFDEFGRIESLRGVDPTLEFDGNMLAPTIRDVAARYPVYENVLTPQQRNALMKIRDAVEPYRDALDEVRLVEEGITGNPSSIKIGSRPDVMDGGFYIPRGIAETEEMAEVAANRVANGRKISGGKQGFEKTADFPSESYGIELGYNYTPVDQSVGAYVRGIGNRAIDRHVANYLLTRVDDSGKAIAESLANTNTRLANRISLAGLEDYSFPVVIANEAEKEIRRTLQNEGDISEALKFVNNTMRGVQATGEMSYLGIQNAVGNVVNPRAGASATKASIKAWLDAGDEVLGDFIARYDVDAARTGTPLSEKWAASGLRLGESGTEFQTARKMPNIISKQAEKIPSRLAKVAGIPKSIVERADRGFGVAGDTMRLELAKTEYEALAAKLGRPPSDAELKKIAESVNRVTGWTGKQFFTDASSFLLFAPRYLSARVRAIGQLASSDPTKRMLARRLIGRYIGAMTTMTIALNYLNGEETDFRPFSGSKGPTFNPLDAEYKNPNFMRVRNLLGRDWSLLGPVDATLGTAIAAGSLATNPTGNPKEVAKRLRSVFSAPLASIANDWLVTGETFDNRPLDITTGEGIADISRRFAPFGAVQTAPDIASGIESLQKQDYAKAAGDAVGSVITGFFGGRGSRLTPREQVLEGNYYKLSPEEQASAIKAQAWREVGMNKGVPENLQNIVKQYPSVFQWREKAFETYKKRALDAGYGELAAEKWAEQKVESNPINKFYLESRSYYQSEFIRKNTKLAEKIIQQDMRIADETKRRLSPRKEDIEVLSGVR